MKIKKIPPSGLPYLTLLLTMDIMFYNRISYTIKALTPAETFVVVEQFNIHQPNHSLQKMHRAEFISLSLF